MPVPIEVNNVKIVELFGIILQNEFNEVSVKLFNSISMSKTHQNVCGEILYMQKSEC